jgi:hypothetical protein
MYLLGSTIDSLRLVISGTVCASALIIKRVALSEWGSSDTKRQRKFKMSRLSAAGVFTKGLGHLFRRFTASPPQTDFKGRIPFQPWHEIQ